jgi:hypothetical protein
MDATVVKYPDRQVIQGSGCGMLHLFADARSLVQENRPAASSILLATRLGEGAPGPIDIVRPALEEHALLVV